MFFQCWTTMLYQCCRMLKIKLQILFHFQIWINIISMVIHNVEAVLIQLWNVGWVASMKNLILRNILPATLPAKWNSQVFFKDYAKAFTKLWKFLVCNRCLLKASNFVKKIKQITRARKCNISKYLVWVNKALNDKTTVSTSSGYSALVLMDNVFSKLGSFKLSCYLPFPRNSCKVIVTWITFRGCQIHPHICSVPALHCSCINLLCHQ